MFSDDYFASVTRGIENCHVFLSPPNMEGYTKAIRLIESREGSRTNCLWSVKSAAICLSSIGYFEKKSIAELKQWAYVASKLEIMQVHLEPFGNLESLFWPLLSDNFEVSSWWQQHQLFAENLRDPGDKDNFKTDAYFRLQIFRALNGECVDLHRKLTHLAA